jgi:Zn-dependent membrane protease YugP
MFEYILLFGGMAICLLASLYLRLTYSKYSRIRCQSNMTGAEAAMRILKSSGIYDVSVGRVPGNLTDHYDPRKKVLRLSDSVYDSNSVAAVGVAAHECGHAIQHNQSYAPLVLRSLMVPVANIGSKLGFLLIIIGLALSGVEYYVGNTPIGTLLFTIGIFGFAIAVLFQLVTLPVEFNASSRALTVLGDYGIMGSQEINDGRRVLNAAAMTYVAAAASAILQLLRLLLLRGRR